MAVRAVDDNRVRTWDVEAVLDDAGCTEHVVFAVHEREHHALQLSFGHLAVADDDARLRHELTNLRRHLVDRLDAVGDEVRLAAALELYLNRRADQLLVELRDDGLD